MRPPNGHEAGGRSGAGTRRATEGRPAKPPLRGGFDPEAFGRLAAVEERHFWFGARNAVIGTVTRQVTAGLPPGYRLLEVGCGTGNVLRVLDRVCADGEVVGADLYGEGLQFARRRTAAPVVQADIGHLPFKQPFAAIGLFDVIEHLPDDVDALRAVRPLLAPGGALLVTVPAHPSLWSYFDEAAYHYRRYRPGDLRRALHTAGYRVEYQTQFMSAITPMVWLKRRLATLLGRRGLGATRGCCAHELVGSEFHLHPRMNGMLARLLRWEAPVIARRGRLPIGTSLLAIARTIDTPCS